MSEVETQPTDASVEQTLAVVSHVLSDPEFAAAVRKHNDWVEGLSSDQTAVLFLASRYQWAVSLLSLQTTTLRAEMDAVNKELRALGDAFLATRGIRTPEDVE